MTAVDARFAGGPIIVDQRQASYDVATELVTVSAPGWDTSLFPHEARALAAALTAAADEAERRGTRLKRRRDVNDDLAALDG